MNAASINTKHEHNSDKLTSPVVTMVACEGNEVLLTAKMKSHGEHGVTTQLLDCRTNMCISTEVTFQNYEELNCFCTIIKGISLLIYTKTKWHTSIFSTN
jgi:hypothetical protein